LIRSAHHNGAKIYYFLCSPGRPALHNKNYELSVPNDLIDAAWQNEQNKNSPFSEFASPLDAVPCDAEGGT
jgi:hypothetical protein